MSSSAQLNKPSETAISSDEAKPIEVSSRTVTLSATTTATVPLTAHAPVAISNPNTNNNDTGHKSQPSWPPAPASGDKKKRNSKLLFTLKMCPPSIVAQETTLNCILIFLLF